MNRSWGVYGVQGRLVGGKETPASDRDAVSFFVRWRVDGRKRRRTIKPRGHAKTFQETLVAAKNQGWDADDRGWPHDPGSLINGQHHRTLTDAGLLLARARDRVGRGGLGSSMPRATTLLRLLPVGSALVILCAGLVLVSQGLRVAV